MFHRIMVIKVIFTLNINERPVRQTALGAEIFI